MPRNATMVTVRSGDIEVTANSQSFPVHSGQTAYFDNSGNAPDIEALGQADDFDSFVVAGDRMEDVPPPQYVSPDMVGYEDLNANGDWRNRRMARYGLRASPPAGSPITTATGSGSHPGAGLGSMTLPGASRRSITGAGLMSTTVGDGTLAWWRCVLTTRPQWWRSSAVRDSA